MIKTMDIETPSGARSQYLQSSERGDFPTRINRILVPTDRTKESEGAIKAGVALAQSFGAQLTLLHVYQAPYEAEIAYIPGPYSPDALLEERMNLENLPKTKAEEIRKYCPACNTEFREGAPCKEIVKAVEERDIDLIVVSTHHYNWLRRLASGCDAEQIVRHASCSILVLQANNA